MFIEQVPGFVRNLFQKALWRMNPDEKAVYLTFDDGPGKHTQRLLDLLEQYNAKATFFVVNTGYSMKKMLNAIVNGGHGIGMHSVTHKYAEIYASEEAFFKDLQCLLHFIDLKYICDSGVILSLAWSLIE